MPGGSVTINWEEGVEMKGALAAVMCAAQYADITVIFRENGDRIVVSWDCGANVFSVRRVTDVSILMAATT